MAKKDPEMRYTKDLTPKKYRMAALKAIYILETQMRNRIIEQILIQYSTVQNKVGMKVIKLLLNQGSLTHSKNSNT